MKLTRFRPFVTIRLRAWHAPESSDSAECFTVGAGDPRSGMDLRFLTRCRPAGQPLRSGLHNSPHAGTRLPKSNLLDTFSAPDELD